ncbi:hypothetical protein BASA83_007478 [Batrachochytrium salamandrivorans]|nr:hypothetical protein BASA83_007478 [Batrachochytrium salamandrivorans]
MELRLKSSRIAASLSWLKESTCLSERTRSDTGTTPYHPPTNGMVERMHAMLGHGLTTLVHGKRDRWDEYSSSSILRTRTHGDMVKMKHHERLKLEFRWKGPYHVDVGHPGTYWIMTPQGLRLPNAVNQNDLAPWLSPVLTMVLFTKRESLPGTIRFPCANAVTHSKDGEVVADLSAHKIWRKKAYSPKEPESRAIANRAILECATSSNPAPTPREPKVVFLTNSTDLAVLRGFLNQLELIFGYNHLPTAPSTKDCNSRYYYPEELIWYIPMVEYPLWPFLHSFVGKASRKHDQYFGIADQTQESISKIRVLGQGSQPCASYVATFRQLATDLEWNDSALQSQFYWGELGSQRRSSPSSKPTSLSEAMTLAIKIEIAFRNVVGNRRSLLDPCPSDHPTTFHVLEGHLINPENPTINNSSSSTHQLQHQHQLPSRVPNKLLDSTCCKANPTTWT